MSVHAGLEALGLTVWAKAGGGVRILGLSALPPDRQAEARAFIRSHKAELAGLALPPLASHGGPDYAAWCADYFQGCFQCPDFLLDRVRFCRKWNLTFHGVNVMEVEGSGEESPAKGRALPPLPESSSPDPTPRHAWWKNNTENSPC